MPKITIALMRDLEYKVKKGEISYSRMVEIINKTVQGYSDPLKERFEKICNEYAVKFAQKQEIEFEGWLSEIGMYAEFSNESCFEFHLIKHDVDTNQPKGLIFEWQEEYNKHLKSGDRISYYAWCMGLRYDLLK